MQPVVAACFVVSGLTALIFEVLWVRMLTTWIFGASHLAVATVLAVFMGGLALGSWLAGRVADRLRRPVVAYALLEGGVGLYGLLLPLLLQLVPEIHRMLWSSLQDSFYLFSLVRFLLAAVLLILPTTLMGATLPVLSSHVVSRASDAGRKVGWLYTLNLFGAVAGVGLGGFVLLPGLGVQTTNTVAAAVALVLCGTVLGLARRGSLRSAPEIEALGELLHPERIAAHAAEVNALPRWSVRLVVLCFGLGGFAAMVYQVVWTRTLILAFGSSVYSFTLILLAFLVGLAVGSLYFTARRVDRIRHGVSVLGRLYLAIALTALASSLFIDQLPFAVLALVREGRVHVGSLLFSEFLLTGAILLLPTAGMGAVFPLVIRLTARDAEGVGGDVGRVYAANTVGAILGSFGAGFVFLPFLGAQGALTVALVINLLLAAVLAQAGWWVHGTGRRAALGWTAASLVAAAGIALVPTWDAARLSAGLFRVYVAHEVYGDYDWRPPDKILFFKHGTSCTVTVEQRGDDSLALKVNGKTDASSRSDMPTQILVSALPLLLAEDPQDVAIVGYGSGVTVGAALQFPVRSVTAVELEAAVVEGAAFFRDVAHRPLEDPRLTLVHDDGRNMLAATEQRFDVIVSEPSNPWITGVSNLFTTDYFRLAKQRLKPGGVFCQWLQMYELSEENIKTIARTFAASFEHLLLFVSEAESTDAIMIGADHPLTIDLVALHQAFEDPRTRAELERAKVTAPEDVAALFLVGDQEIDRVVGPGPLNTDDNLLIEFAAPRDMLQYTRFREFALELYYRDAADVDLLRYVRGLPEAPTGRSAALTELSYALLRHGRVVAARELAERALALHPTPRARRARLMSLLFVQEDRYPPLVHWPEEGDPHYGDYALVRDYLERNRFGDAAREIAERPEVFLEDAEFRFLLGFLLYADNQFEEAGQVLAELLEDEPDYALLEPPVVYYLARTHAWQTDSVEAVVEMERFLDLQNLAPEYRDPVPPEGAAAGPASPEGAATGPAPPGEPG